MADAEQQPPATREAAVPESRPVGIPPGPSAEERTLWDGTPSQLINFPFFLLCAVIIGGLIGGAVLLRDRNQTAAIILGACAALPLFFAFWRWLKTRSHKYHLTTERLQMTEGIFSRRSEDLELYRVKDYHIIEPFTMRLFGLADIVLNTMDDANPTVKLMAISGGARLRDEIRKHVELCRDRKRVRVSEFES